MRIGRDVTSIVAALHASWRSARGMCSMNTSSLSCVYIAVVHVHALMHSHNHRHFLVPRGPSRTFWEPLILYTSSFARFARSATSPLFAYMTIPAPNSSLCRAADPAIVSASATASWLLLLAACVRSYATAALSHRFQQLPNCVHFGCSSPIASDSTAAPRLRPLQLQLPDCVHFDCYTPIASACSLTCSGRFQPMPNVLELSS